MDSGLHAGLTLQWCHNEHHGVSNHRRLDCLLNHLLRRTSIKKHQSSASLACLMGVHRSPVDSPHKRGKCFHLVKSTCYCGYVPVDFVYIIQVCWFQWYWGSPTLPQVNHCMWSNSRKMHPWWRHQMKTFSALLALCAGNSMVTGEFPSQRPVTRSFDVIFDLRLGKRLSRRKPSWGWWFKTQSRSLWRHCNARCLTLPSLHVLMGLGFCALVISVNPVT